MSDAPRNNSQQQTSSLRTYQVSKIVAQTIFTTHTPHYGHAYDKLAAASRSRLTTSIRTHQLSLLTIPLTYFLHQLVLDRCSKDLLNNQDQGKVARCLADDQYANGSTWHCTGLNIRFKDWRFIHRARLNLLPVNAVKSRFSNTDPACRHCVQPETLPHVICHCRPHMVQIRSRHNAIVDRLTKQSPQIELSQILILTFGLTLSLKRTTP